MLHRAITIFSLALFTCTTFAGDLTPPAGPPASTMKTLVEVEPRTAINSVNTPGDADSIYRISQPGSYYLTANITGVSGKSGIEIASSDVTIDLKGLTLTGVAGTLDGITTSGIQNRITIRNGTVASWGVMGIGLITGGTGTGSLIESIHAVSNGQMGIRANENAIVHNCIAENNGTIGINIPGVGSITNCTSRDNNSFGISSGSAATISGCNVQLNGNAGMSAGAGSTVTDCVAFQNSSTGIFASSNSLITNCTARLNGSNGFSVGINCTISNCVSNSNSIGFSIAGQCTVMNSQAHSNTSNAGILISAGNCRIDSNTCTGNLWGIRATSGGNFITRNICSDNGTNWDIVVNNVCLVVIANPAAAFSGNSGGAAPGSTDPNANFTY